MLEHGQVRAKGRTLNTSCGASVGPRSHREVASTRSRIKTDGTRSVHDDDARGSETSTYRTVGGGGVEDRFRTRLPVNFFQIGRASCRERV